MAVLWGTLIPSITPSSSSFLQGIFIYPSNSKGINNIFPHVPTELSLHHPYSSLCPPLVSGVPWTWHIFLFLLQCIYGFPGCRHHQNPCWWNCMYDRSGHGENMQLWGTGLLSYWFHGSVIWRSIERFELIHYTPIKDSPFQLAWSLSALWLLTKTRTIDSIASQAT